MRNALLLPVYVPTALLAFGQGMLIPTLPVYAASFDVPFTLVSLAVSAAALGTLVTDLPAGMLLGRIGRKPAMLLGAGLVAVSTLLVGLTHYFPELVIYRLLAGVGTALWGISRHAYITDIIPIAQRGRSISVFGGISRIGTFGGPVVGGLVAASLGLNAPFLLAAVLAIVATVVAVLFVPESGPAGGTMPRQAVRWRIVGELLRTHRADLSAAGIAQTFGQMIRAGRQLIIPLYAAAVLGLDVAAIGTIVSAAAVVDMSLFIPAGFIMDRFGRKWASVPSFAIMAAGTAVLPLTVDFWSLMAAAVLIGFGNGLGSGAMMTLGADLAPPGATGEFLGLWRLIGDSGRAGGPLVVGTLADLIGLSLTALALTGIGLASAAMLALLVRETRHATPARPTDAPRAVAGGLSERR